MTILYRSRTSGWVLSVTPVVCLYKPKSEKPITGMASSWPDTTDFAVYTLYLYFYLKGPQTLNNNIYLHDSQTSRNIKLKNESSFLKENTHGHTGKPIHMIATFCATLKCCCWQMHPSTSDFHKKLKITYSKLVCTSTGCPPNAGTALSIKGCDLTKFNVWSDNVFESSVHVCKWTNKNTFTNVRLQELQMQYMHIWCQRYN